MSNEITFTTNDIYYLDKASNPVFYEIIEESNYIMERYSDLTKRLQQFKIPNSYKLVYTISIGCEFRESKSELNSIGNEIADLDIKYLVPWNDKACGFALNPKLNLLAKLTPIENLTVSSHFVSYIRYRINQLVDSVRILYLMHNLEYDRFQNAISSAKQFRQNFWFAASGYILALILAALI